MPRATGRIDKPDFFEPKLGDSGLHGTGRISGDAIHPDGVMRFVKQSGNRWQRLHRAKDFVEVIAILTFPIRDFSEYSWIFPANTP
jgi:hypothetical protein